MAVTMCQALWELLAVLTAQRGTSSWWPPPLPLGLTADPSAGCCGLGFLKQRLWKGTEPGSSQLKAHPGNILTGRGQQPVPGDGCEGRPSVR